MDGGRGLITLNTLLLCHTLAPLAHEHSGGPRWLLHFNKCNVQLSDTVTSGHTATPSLQPLDEVMDLLKKKTELQS